MAALFTSESVAAGHPDKVCDAISDAIVDACLTIDSQARIAVETLVKGKSEKAVIILAGEVSLEGKVPDYEAIARNTAARIGYTSHAIGMDATSAELCEVQIHITTQSANIAQGVDGQSDDVVGAGDQGMMFGYACDETDVLMPLPIQLAHRMAEKHAAVRKGGSIPYLRPDAKTQVTFEYEDDRPVRLATVLVSTQHDAGIDRDNMIRPDLIEQVIKPVIPAQFADDDYEVFVNPTGNFVIGGPVGDAGLTGRKIIVDTYGGMARHGGGAFSGKDPSKVDRSAAYATRWVAKNLVAAGAARRCEVQVAYAIGMARPVSIYVETFGTEAVDPEKIAACVNDIFDLRPAAIIRDLDLKRPIYKKTAAYGHFGRPEFPWEQTNKTAEVQAALGLN